jgi:diaminopimelate epimerase
VAEGGAQEVSWPETAAEMMLTGPAEIVCTGDARVNF